MTNFTVSLAGNENLPVDELSGNLFVVVCPILKYDPNRDNTKDKIDFFSANWHIIDVLCRDIFWCICK